MNKPAWLFGMMSLLLAGSCLYLLLQLRAERTQPDDGLRVQLGELRADRDRLETDVRSLRAIQAGPVLAPQPSAAAASSNPAPAPPTLIRPDFSPQTRRTMIRLRNGKVFRQLGLSEAQEESLLDVLAAQEERALAQSGTLNPNTDPEVRSRNRAEVEAVIGRERAEKLDAWQQQAFARFEIRRLRDQLEDVGEPLSDAQLARVSELVVARASAAPPLRQKDEPSEAHMERWRSWRNDSRELLRAAVSSVLEPRQLERYDELDEISRAFEKSMPLAFPPAQLSAGRAAPASPR